MKRIDYWKECISQAAEGCGLTLTAEQLEYMADAVEGGDENIGQAFYSPEPFRDNEKIELKKKLDAELAKVFCKECKGRGSIVTYGAYHDGISTCWQCNGQGRH